MRAVFPLLAIAMLAGCETTTTPQMVRVEYSVDDHGVAVVTINGNRVEQSAEQRAAQIQLIVDGYCPANPAI